MPMLSAEGCVHGTPWNLAELSPTTGDDISLHFRHAPPNECVGARAKGWFVLPGYGRPGQVRVLIWNVEHGAGAVNRGRPPASSAFQPS